MGEAELAVAQRSLQSPASVTSPRVRQVPATGRPWRARTSLSPQWGHFLTEPAPRAKAPAANAVRERLGGWGGPGRSERGAPRGGGGRPVGTFTGARRFQASPQPARAGSISPPLTPKPINAGHRLSNRLTNAAPPIAGRPGRALSDQASLRASCQFEVIETTPAPAARPRVARLAGAPRRVQVVILTVSSWCSRSSAHRTLYPSPTTSLNSPRQKPLSLPHFIKRLQRPSRFKSKFMCLPPLLKKQTKNPHK